ncbi:PREDICTED: heterogeneous nuclear ribonucleoprotein 1-like [Lupinus angustifolius]|uniref:heterogeneous nuclear ribonucleoprotein 1-like n=1 Tax=Lupinus angustifolius TaxID=3871 RepID=UPI00092E3FE9|nr:PREDICTED: heterogeneous nuclear ribonucleoprotein 1-like [Lupinus angustifolius]
MEMDSSKLFIGGISWDTNEDRLRQYFQNFGDVVEAMIMKDRTTGRARGFGFIVFADPSVAERVVLEKHVIDGRTIYVTFMVIISHLYFAVRLEMINSKIRLEEILLSIKEGKE